MDYEKAYNEAIKRAKAIIEVAEKEEEVYKSAITIFPELRESEDEKIRKALISFLKSPFVNENITDEKVAPWLAWLENQKEYESTDFEYVWDRTDCGDLTSALDKYSEEAIINMCHAWYDKGIELERKSWLEKQCYTKKDVDDAYLKGICNTKHELEKQGEQESADKLEPKFHEGEWITNGDYTWKIAEVKPLDYILQSQDGNIVDDTISHVDEQFHSFTIEDAKDGDVLASELCDSIILFRGIKDDNIDFYCDYDFSKIDIPGDRFTVNNGQHYGNVEDSKDFYPATKEQRDTLFLKMKEAGYEWSEETHELKKISQRMVSAEAKEALYDKPTDEEMKELLRTEYEKGRADTLSETKSSWSEEDEKLLNEIIDFFENGTVRLQHDLSLYAFWLKSLKDRVIPKPKQEWGEEDEK